MDAFKLKITSPTEGVTNGNVTLNFAPGKQVVEDKENGTISDGTIIVPKQVTLGEEFTIQPVKTGLVDNDGLAYESNVGGISSLVITTENNLLSSTTIQIAVDVPVHAISFNLVDSTTGEVFQTGNKIAENTNFEIQTEFYPQNSKYLFSDDKNTAVTQKREKQVFFEPSNTESVNGVSLVYNGGDVYFIASEEPSKNNIINGYAFANAAQQLSFYRDNIQTSGQPLYKEAIHVLSTQEDAVSASVSIDIVEANVRSFTINDTSSSSLKITTNKLFRVSAGTSALSDATINAQIIDMQDNVVSALIKNVGVRVFTIDGKTPDENSTEVTIKGGETVTIEDGEEKASYVLFNSDVKNLNHAYWEVSTTGSHDFVLEVVLIIENEEGQKQVFDKQTQRLVYFETEERTEDDVTWGDIESQLSLSIIYDENGNTIPAQYEKDLNTVSNVPSSNIYQKKIFFVYIDESSALPEGKTLADYVSVSKEGSSRYQFNGTSAYLYPLMGGELIVKDTIDFYLIFATVRTDAYGNVLKTTSGTYMLEQVSTSISVSVDKTLQGLEAYNLQVEEKWLNQEGGNFFVIPTGTAEAFTLNLTLVDGDSEIFMQEYNAGRIKFYAAEDANGERAKDGVFSFGQPEVVGNQVTIQVGVSNFSVSELNGEDYYVCISYNNSINTNVWVAQPTGEGDFYGAIRVYNQTPSSISNDRLEGWKFDVQQSLQTNGNGSISIVGNKTGQEPVMLDSVEAFNQLINGITNEEGERTGGMVIKDQYGRQFEYAYEIVSDDNSVVSFSSEGSNHNVTFGASDPAGKDVGITVRAGRQEFTFTINSKSTGITSIEVGGVKQDSISSAQYTMAGKAGEYVTLKDLIEVYVSAGKYNSDAYTLKISQFTISEQDESLWDMFEFNGGDTTYEGEINQVKINHNFGQNVSILFNAANEQGTLNFNFTLNITSVASDGINNLGNINYNIKGVESGVREQDKPTGEGQLADIVVYSGYKINLDSYLKVNVEGSDFSWENVNVYKDTVYKLTADDGSEIATIQSLAAVPDVFTGGIYLIFNDVQLPVTKTFVLYSLFDDAGNGNPYAYNRSISVTILPNFELTAKDVGEEITLSLKDLYLTAGKYNIANILALKRITENNNNNGFVYTNDLGYKLENFEFIDQSGYLNFDKTVSVYDTGTVSDISIKLNKGIEYDYGEMSKQVVVSMRDDDGIEIASADVNIQIGITVDDMIENGAGDWLGNTVFYDNREVILVANSTEIFNNIIITSGETGSGSEAISVTVGENRNAYSNNQATTPNSRSLAFVLANEISVGDRYYISIRFTSGNSDFASIKVPILISAVGDRFASYQNTEDDLKEILDGTHAPFEIDAGKSYLLALPDKINDKDYIIVEGTKDNESTKDNKIYLINSKLSGTNASFTIDNKEFEIGLSDGNDLILSFSLVGQATGVEISPSAVGVGDVFTLTVTDDSGKTSYTLYLESLEQAGEVYNIGLYQVEELQGIEYSFAKGAFGLEIASLGGKTVLTGLGAKENSYLVNFSVPNQFEDFMRIATNSTFNVPELIVKHIDNSVCTDGYIQAYIEILQSKSNHSYKYNYNLIIESDGIIAQPTYPFDGSTSEFVEMDAGTAKQPTIKEIVLNAQMGDDTQHPGVARISDMFGTSDVSEDATLKIKEVKIGNDVIAISPDGLEANDARFSVKLEGMKVIFKNVSGQNITVVLERSYTQVYGGDITYSFSINAQSVEYFIEYTNPDEDNGTLDGDTWTLSRRKTEQTITAVTKQRTTGGESNVDTARVTTTITHDLPLKTETEDGTVIKDGYTVEYDKENFTLSITQPAFVPQDTTYHIYFTVNGVQTATLNVLIPATVKATQVATPLIAGNTVESSGLITLSEDAGATITGIQVVDDAGNKTTNDYVSVDDEAIAIKLENAIEDQEFKLKFTYKVGEDEGHVIFGYTALANMAGVKEYNAGSIIAGKTKEIDALTYFVDAINGGEITGDDMKNFTISATPQDANIVKAGSVTYDSKTAKLSIKPEYVGANTPTSVTVVFNYKVGEKVLFTLTTQISLVVTPAIKISVNYPAPAGESLGYESIQATTTDPTTGTTTDTATVEGFFTGTALFADKERFIVQAYTETGLEEVESTIDTTEDFTFSVVQSSNITVTRNGDTLTIKRGTEAGLSYATIQIIYKGVVAQYTIYAFDKLITSTPNATINKVGTTEVIYADRTNTDGLGGRYRLLELNVTENASNGSIYSIYAKSKTQSQADDETNLGTFLTSFKMSSTYFNSTIYVDHGNNNLKQVGDTFKLGDQEVDIIICIGNVQIADGSITFSRLAGRVEYHYATNDGNSILITSDKITYDSDLTLEGEGNTSWDKDETATLTVTYDLESTTGAGTTTLTLVKKLDITVEMEYSAASPTIVEVEAHKNSHYKLSELAGITFASTGEKLTAANIGDVKLSVEIIDTKPDGWNKKDLVYQNDDGSAYLLFTNITGGENKVVYDFYLYAQGCSVDGDYAAVRFTYKISDDVSESFIIIVKIIPDYQVTIAGNVVAEAGNVYEDADSKTGEDYYVSNQQRPYEFTPVVTGEGEETTYKAMTLASSEQPTDQLISVVRQNWNATNIAYSFNYSIKVMADGSAYNTTSTIGKLNLSKETGWGGGSVNAGSTWKPSNSNAAKITPKEVVFGTKSYMVELSDKFGYIIRFYFNLVPSSDQQPVVYESASAATFTEGTPFDVGLVYDSIAVQKADTETGTQASVTVNQSLTPNTQDVSSIILQNIDAWGYTTAGVQRDDAPGIDGKYYNAPTFANVTITNITFRFDESTAKDVPIQNVQMLKDLYNTTCDAMPGQGVSYNGVEYTYNPTANGIQLTTSLQVIAKEEAVAGKDEKVTKYYIYMNGATDPTGDPIGEDEDGYRYEVEFDEDSGNITKIGDVEVKPEDGIYTLKKDASNNPLITFKVRKQGTNTYLNFTFTGTGTETSTGTIKGTSGEIYLDLEKDPTNYTTEEASTTRLATDVTLAPLYTTPATGTNTASLGAWTDVYRDISAAYFKVPIMPGWIYGTSDSANVTIYITLQYAVEGTGGTTNTETCQVAYNATIVKNIRISSKSRVVVDAVGFDLGGDNGKISVTNQGTEPTGKAVYYDDTLVVVVPKQGQVTLTVTFGSGDSAVEKTTTITNTNTTRKVSNYVSLSELYGKTLDPSVSIKVTWSTSDNSDDSEAAVYYHTQSVTAGSPIATYTEIPQSGKVIAKDGSWLPAVTRDVLYIEHAGRISGSDSFQVRKSYIVGVKYGEKYEYYQYRHDYLVTSRYTYFSDGLTGGDTVYEIEGKNEKDKYTTAYDPTNGYTVAFDQWAGNIWVYKATDGDSGGLMQGDGAKLNEVAQPSYLRYEVAKLNDDDPNPPTASFAADGETLYTGADYSANKNQYIRINIYVKASGGPKTPWGGNDEYDKLLGFIIITLTTGWD